MKSFALCALWLALAGCARYEPEPLHPADSLAALGSTRLESVQSVRVAPGQEPRPARDVFNLEDGLDEAELVALALTLNPELGARRARAGEAQAALIAAGLWPNPELSISPRWGISGANGLALEADAMFELLRPARRDARKQVAAARADEARYASIAEEYELVRAVRKAHLKVMAAERTSALLAEDVALRQRLLDLAKRQRNVGEGTELDVAAAELDLAEAQRDLRLSQTAEQSDSMQLNRLLGLPLERPIPLSHRGKPLLVPVYDDLDISEINQRLLGRVELRAIQSAYRAAEEELRLAVLKQYPELKIGPAIERDTDGGWALGLGMSLELPLLNQNQDEIAEKAAARTRVRAEFMAALSRLRADAVAAWTAARLARAEVEAQERDILPRLKRTQDLYEGAYRARELKVIEWIAAQQRALRARREHLDALVRYREAVIDLETALGMELSQPSGAQLRKSLP